MAIGLAEKKVVVGGVNAKPVDSNRFDALVLALKEALGPSSGLTSADVDVPQLAQLMGEYDANEEGWLQYKLGDASRGYTRNLVDEGNGKSNLVSRRCPTEAFDTN